jgi:hypothetical protein
VDRRPIDEAGTEPANETPQVAEVPFEHGLAGVEVAAHPLHSLITLRIAKGGPIRGSKRVEWIARQSERHMGVRHEILTLEDECPTIPS